MTGLPDIRQKVDTFELRGRELTMLQREGDPYNLVRLAYTGELDDELGRIVKLDTIKPQLATALAVWTPAIRDEVLRTVQQRWRFYELEVIA